MDWSLSWRFANLPAVANKVIVLPEVEELRARHWIRDHHDHLVASASRVTFDLSHDPDSECMRIWDSVAHPGATCTLVWDGPHEAVQVPAGDAFVHLSDFWYPGSDDLWIIETDSKWMVFCHHHGWACLVRLEVEDRM